MGEVGKRRNDVNDKTAGRRKGKWQGKEVDWEQSETGEEEDKGQKKEEKKQEEWKGVRKGKMKRKKM